MANQWFRMYAEFVTDPKVQMLSEADQRRYIMLLCIRCNGHVTLHDEEIAFQLRVSADEWAKTKAVLVGKGLIDEGANPVNWDKRQMRSDSSAERVARHREKKKNADVTLQKQVANGLDTDTEESKQSSNEDCVASKQATNCPHQKIIDLYGSHLPGLPYPRIWEGRRQQNLASRWRWVLTARKPDGARYATDTESALSFFDRFFAYVSRSDFLTGRDGKWQGCDLGWLMKAENFAKVLSGNYENKEAA
ncbi:hypothetical protein ACLIIZ_03170 [Azonexus caeni]|uniref:hypothetical protein n=1 Tax=Azonexus caeni TaxID=266126 RepID=UPI003A8998EC